MKNIYNFMLQSIQQTPINNNITTTTAVEQEPLQVSCRHRINCYFTLLTLTSNFTNQFFFFLRLLICWWR